MYTDNICYSTCPERYFPNDRFRICQPCPYDCQTCDGTGACLSCNSSDNRLFSNSTQRCVPFDGYFDNISRIAVLCPYGCIVCSSLTKCSTCLPGFFLMRGSICYQTCPARYIGNTQSFTCESCPYDCYFCDNSRQCLSCNDTTDFRTLNLETMRCKPLIGYFDN